MSSRLPAIDFRRLQRTYPTDAEARIWQVLRNRHLGAKFRRQATVGRFTLDFFCSPLRLAVEIDGAQRRDDVGLRYDADRDAALATAGIRVLRFSNQEALGATEGVALAILGEVERLTDSGFQLPPGSSRRRDAPLPHPDPLPRGGRGEGSHGLNLSLEEGEGGRGADAEGAPP